MKTYVQAEAGTPFAFEIENAYLSRAKIATLLKSVPGVESVSSVSHFGSSNDVRVAFKMDGHDYIVMEPFGDNSRYWVGPKEGKDDKPAAGNIGKIKDVFDAYRAPLPARILGDLLSLNFKGLFSRRE
jgi:hypothetical protein